MDTVEEMGPPTEEGEKLEKEVEEEKEVEDGEDNKGGDEEQECGDDQEEEEKEDGEDSERDDEEQECGDDQEEEEKEDGEDSERDDEEQECGDDQEEEAAATNLQAVIKSKKTIPVPVKPKEKKQDNTLNLNNEVVKMRKEVKRVRALITRKLTRQIGALKKKKGKDTEVERNQRRAARLLEEIHAMKILSPDLVTKTALQKKLNFEHVCKNPKSTISDRATARIATHPQFNKKIEDIKAAVRAFKEERMKAMKEGKEKVQNKPAKVTPPTPVKMEEVKSDIDEEDFTVQQKEILDDEEVDGSSEDVTVAEPEKETSPSTVTADQKKEIPASINSSEVKDVAENEPQSKPAKKKADPKPAEKKVDPKPAEKKADPKPADKKADPKPAVKKADPKPAVKKADPKPAVKKADPISSQKKEDELESDLESSDDEEKVYYDDSTEERFLKQSSQSEESDDGFFVGKVSKFKRKKKPKNVDGEKADKGCEANSSDQVQSGLDELEARLKSKATSFQTVFCSSLSSSKPGGGRGAGRGRGSGRGRGGDRFRGEWKPKGGGGLDRDFSKQSEFQKQERNPGYNKPRPEASERGRGRGRGRGDFMRQNDRRSGGVFTQKEPQQALHPSWEASKKRKEQQGQILAFQGKKIKFDDD